LKKAAFDAGALFLDSFFHQADELFDRKYNPENKNNESNSPDEPRQPIKSHRIS
jgi:hypothetical protein